MYTLITLAQLVTSRTHIHHHSTAMDDNSVLHALTKQEAQAYVDQALSRSSAIKQIIKAMNKVTHDVERDFSHRSCIALLRKHSLTCSYLLSSVNPLYVSLSE